MSSIQPELWVAHPAAAIAFYRSAFGATVLHQVGGGDGDGDDSGEESGDDVVAQLEVGGAAFWVAAADPSMGRLSPGDGGAATSRFLLVVDDPDAVVARSVAAGATLLSAPDDEHDWRLGRVRDPAGHEWEIGRPLGSWPPD